MIDGSSGLSKTYSSQQDAQNEQVEPRQVTLLLLIGAE